MRTDEQEENNIGAGFVFFYFLGGSSGVCALKIVVVLLGFARGHYSDKDS